MRDLLFLMFVLLLSASGFAQLLELRETASAHFKIQFGSDYDDDEVEMVGSELELAYRLLNQKYGLKVQKKLPVYLTSSEVSYNRKVPVRERWGAAYSNRTLYFQPMSYIRKNGGLRITVRHALAFAMLRPIVASGCPPWLARSFAVNFSGEMEILSKPSQTRIKFFTDLNEVLEEARGLPDLETSYYTAGLAVRYFEERFGSRKVADLIKSFDGRSLDNQVKEKVFGLPFNDLQYEWVQYVDRRINASQ
ncbi:MAG: hypothetical protein V3U68_00890 [Bacteroidota bacterium]